MLVETVKLSNEVEREYIHEYAAKYGDKLKNKRDNPLVWKKQVKFKVEMENNFKKNSYVRD